MLKKLLAAAAAVAAASVCPAAAYTAADICNVHVTVTYDDLTTIGFVIKDQDTTGSAQLQPGTFTIAVEGRLCSNPATKGYTGSTSSPTTIDGSEAEPVSIAIVALDLQTYGSELDQSLEQDPIIVSISVSPAIVRIGDTATMSFAAIDPIDGVDPTGYALTMASPGGNGVFPGGKTCGGGVSCSLSYTAGVGDAGNIPFSMQVSDAAANTDTVAGYVAIDSTGEVTLDVLNYHIPVMGTPVVSGGDPKVGYGNTGTITIPVTDVDLLNAGLADSVALEFTITPIETLTEGGQAAIGCDAADVSISSSVTDAVAEFTVVWDPWAGDGNTAAFYGETWCKLTFTARDSSPGAGLVSQDVVFTMAAIGTPATGGGFGQLPVFSLLFVEDSAPVVGQDVSLTLQYADADSTTQLEVDDGGLSAGTSYGPFAGEDCRSSACTRTISLTTDGSPGPHTVTLTLTDEADPSLQDIRTIVITSSASRRGRNRRSGAGAADDKPNTYRTSLNIGADGVLTGSVDRTASAPHGTGGNSGGGGGGATAGGNSAGSAGTGNAGGQGQGQDPNTALVATIVAFCVLVVVAVLAATQRRAGAGHRPVRDAAAFAPTDADGQSGKVMVFEPEFDERNMSSV